MIPICNRTHYTIQLGFSKCNNLVEAAKQGGYSHVGIMDISSIAGSVEFADEVEKVDGLIPIFGVSLYIDDRHYVNLIAKNLDGWNNIIKLVSLSYDVDNINSPKISFLSLNEYRDGLICVFSHDIDTITSKLHSIFDDDFYIGVDKRNTDVSPVIANNIEKLSQSKYQKIPFLESYYPKREDYIDHQAILCSKLDITYGELQNHNSDSFITEKHFTNPIMNYAIPGSEDFQGYSDEETNNFKKLLGKIEKFSIKKKPSLPEFKWTDGMSELDYVLHLCRLGYEKKFDNWNPDVYGPRVKKELATIEEAGLAGYFLIVLDYVNWARNQGILVGPGRGSAGGSLVSYLLGITTVNPIPFGLIFERFYNAGRNTPGRIAYPDIDVDFPPQAREQVIEYVRDKYGHDRVAQICTFGELKGRGAIKEVMKIHNVGSFNLRNMISQLIPKPEKVADEMQNVGEDSLIKFALSYSPYREKINDYARLNENDEIEGDYASYFKQAIRLEGTYKSIGRHASGIIISNDKLSDVCPMMRLDSCDEKVIQWEMNSLEQAGQIKFDILGLSSLARVQGALNLLKFGKVMV